MGVSIPVRYVTHLRPGETVRVKVSDLHPEPAAWVHLTLERHGDGTLSLRLEPADGVANLEGIEPGLYNVHLLTDAEDA